MVRDAFAVWNPWAVFGNELFTLGLDVKECAVLAFAVFALILAGHLQERGLLSHGMVRGAAPGDPVGNPFGDHRGVLDLWDLRLGI